MDTLAAVSASWDARTYDRASRPQQEWAWAVLERIAGRLPKGAAVLDVGCGTGRVTEALLELVPDGQVLAIDASQEMVELARRRLGDRARVWRRDVLDLVLDEAVDAVVSTATLHWVVDHDRLWRRLAAALRPGGILEIQCGGQGQHRPRSPGDRHGRSRFVSGLQGWSPWTFAGPDETHARLEAAGFTSVRCWSEDQPTWPDDLGPFVQSSILPAHLARLPEERREPFVVAVLQRVRAPLDYVRLNASAVRA